jgi:acyl-CoA thioesterase YciA
MSEEAPRGEAAIRTVPRPADTNPSGDIFGGWLMAQMDVAGAVVAVPRAGGRVVTVAADAMVFHRPVFVGDLVSFHGEVTRVGRTSVQVRVEAWARRRNGRDERVTTGVFTFVRVGDDRRPIPVEPPAEA